MRVNYRIGVAVAALMVLAACGGSSTAATSGEPFNVLVVSNLSSGAGPANAAFVQGMEAAGNYLNSNGGILGHKLTFTTRDTGGDNTQSVTLVTQMLQSKPTGGGTWNFIQSGASSDEQLAELPTVTKYKVPGIAVESNPKLATFAYHWIEGVNISTEVATITAYLKSQNFQKVGFFYQNNAVGTASEALIGPAFAAAGITELKVSYPATAVDVTPQMQQMQAQHPDAVLATAQSGPWIGYVLKAKAALNFNVPFLGDATFSGADAYTIAGAANVAGVKYYQWNVDLFVPPSQQNAATTTFRTWLGKITSTYTQPMHQYASGWDAIQYMKIAATQANSLDPDKIKAALDSLKIPNPSPLVTSPQGWGWNDDPTTGHLSHPAPGAFVVCDIGPLSNGQIQIDLNSVYPKPS
jgi:branched-chain amino acid transport system substrate-binding protein